jgi:hypothetical protein
MSRRLDHRHKVRLYVEKAALWNPADALNVRLRASRRSLSGRLLIHSAIDDPAGNRKGDDRTGSGGPLD